MKLSVKDRIVLGLLFPKEGNMIEMAHAKEVKAKTDLTTKELETINYEVLDNGAVKWDDDKLEDAEINLSPKELVFLGEQVDRLDKEKKISSDIYSTCKAIRDVLA